MTININNMRSALRYGGARPTLFRVTLPNPVTAVADLKIPFLVQASGLPASTLGNIRVPYMGRTINVPGDREFQPWSIDVINDEDFAIRDALETWSHSINTLEGNVRNFATSESSFYTTTAIVEQLNKAGNPIRKYEFLNAWPAEVGPIQLSWGAVDQIETFQVTFMYDTYRTTGITGTGASGANI